MQFQTDFRYTDRQTKAQYVWLKYQTILRGRKILDVGADECHLKQYLDSEATYWGIGLGGTPDQQINLEQGPLPFADNSYDCVLCLDVLEHIENIHQTFDELCRVSKRYVVVSLPNAWEGFYRLLRHRDDRPGVVHPLKYYGLPLDAPEDRHKWFFSFSEARAFLEYRSAKNEMQVVQIDADGRGNEGRGWKRQVRLLARSILFRNPQLPLDDLYLGTLWAVLEKQHSS